MVDTFDDRIIFATLLGKEVNLFEAGVIQFYLTDENKGKDIYQNCPPSKQSVSLIALDDRIFFVTLLGEEVNLFGADVMGAARHPLSAHPLLGRLNMPPWVTCARKTYSLGMRADVID